MAAGRLLRFPHLLGPYWPYFPSPQSGAPRPEAYRVPHGTRNSSGYGHIAPARHHFDSTPLAAATIVPKKLARLPVATVTRDRSQLYQGTSSAFVQYRTERPSRRLVITGKLRLAPRKVTRSLLQNARQEERDHPVPVSVRSLTIQVKALAHLLHNLTSIDVRSALWPFLKSFIASYGYSRLTVFVHLPVQGSAATQVLYSDLDSETLDRFKRTAVHHPIFVHALRSTEPFARSELDPIGVDVDTAPPEEHLYAGEGLVVPMASGGIARGVAVLGGNAPDLSSVARSIVHVAAETAFHRAQILPAGDGGQPIASVLSQREVAILNWAASGKTDAEIGDLVKIQRTDGSGFTATMRNANWA